MPVRQIIYQCAEHKTEYAHSWAYFEHLLGSHPVSLAEQVHLVSEAIDSGVKGQALEKEESKRKVASYVDSMKKMGIEQSYIHDVLLERRASKRKETKLQVLSMLGKTLRKPIDRNAFEEALVQLSSEVKA